MRLLLHSLMTHGTHLDFRQPVKFAPSVVPLSDIELFLDIEVSDLTADELADLRPDLARIMATDIPTPQFRKVHDWWGRTPSGHLLFPPEVTLGSIYLVRDPRDIAVSWAHFRGQTVDEAIAFLARNDATLLPDGQSCWRPQLRQHLSNWSEHVASWLKADPVPLVVRYEDLLAETAATLAKVVSHCKLEVSAATLDAAIAATRFEVLKAAEEKNGFFLGQTMGQKFFRRGVAGGWRDSLTSAQAEQIVARHGAMMARFGYV